MVLKELFHIIPTDADVIPNSIAGQVASLDYSINGWRGQLPLKSQLLNRTKIRLFTLLYIHILRLTFNFRYCILTEIDPVLVI
jgi:hypothetical protein